MKSDLPFNYLHKLVFVNLVYIFILWINVFLIKNGVPQNFSSRSIMVHTKLSWKQHCHINFGDYANVHYEPDPRNNVTPITYSEIAAITNGNFNGPVKFVFLGNWPNPEA